MNFKEESTNLDLLRSLAVLYVLGFHLYLFFAQNHYTERVQVGQIRLWAIGHWGVLIFFVHTCLVLMFSLERLGLRHGDRGVYLPFLIQRAFRIFPLAILVVVLTIGLGLPGTLADGHFAQVHLSPVGIAANLLLLQNVFHVQPITAPMWSLPYEVEMYLLLPLIFIAVRAARGVLLPLLLWGSTALAAVFLYNMTAPTSEHSGLAAGFPDLLIYAPCFLAGVAGYQFAKERHLRLPAAFWPVLVAVVSAAYLARPSYKMGWACCLALGCAVPQFKELSSPWLRRPCQLIARYSYGIYLTHFVLIWLGFQALGFLPMWSRCVVFAVTATVIPVVLYHALEKPMIRLGKRIATPGAPLTGLPLPAPAGR